MHRRTIASLSGILRMHHYYVLKWLFGVDIWRRDINPKNSPLYVVICLLKVDMWRDIIRCGEDWLCMSTEVVCCTVSHHQKIEQAGACELFWYCRNRSIVILDSLTSPDDPQCIALQWDTSTDPDGSVLGDAIASFAHQVRWGPHREAHQVNVNVNTRGIGRTCEMTRVIRSGICRKLDLTASWATHQSPMLKARDSDKSLKVVNDLQMHL